MWWGQPDTDGVRQAVSSGPQGRARVAGDESKPSPGHACPALPPYACLSFPSCLPMHASPCPRPCSPCLPTPMPMHFPCPCPCPMSMPPRAHTPLQFRTRVELMRDGGVPLEALAALGVGSEQHMELPYGEVLGSLPEEQGVQLEFWRSAQGRGGLQGGGH